MLSAVVLVNRVIVVRVELLDFYIANFSVREVMVLVVGEDCTPIRRR